MPTTKDRPCCARTRARLVMDEANLRRLAQRAARRAEKGLSVVELSVAIGRAKLDVERDKQAIVDHDASHAGGGL